MTKYKEDQNMKKFTTRFLTVFLAIAMLIVSLPMGVFAEELREAMIKRIKEKDSNLVGRMETQGTTPRQLTDLLGSLSDLTSGSGDKGTPVILIQNYFTNYANQ